MTLRRLLFRNLLYHWRDNSAVLMGVAVGAAVLTGALLVGDSLQGSLRQLTLQQLGWVDYSLVAGRFIREDLAGRLGAGHVSPAILLQGSTSAGDAQQVVRRAGHVAILGVDDRFWFQFVPPGSKETWQSANAAVVLNAALADELSVTAGGTVTLHLQKVSLVPRGTLLGRRDSSDVIDELKVTVAAVIPNEGLGRFSLSPNPAAPRNAFVPLRLLQTKLQQEGRVNALLVGGATGALQEDLQKAMTLDDWGLLLHTPESRAKALFDKLDRNHDGKLTSNEWRRRVAESFARAADRNHDGILDLAEVLAFYQEQRGYLCLESRQMILEPAVADAALLAARDVGLRTGPTLVYLANSISDGKEAIPYSVVAGLDPALPPPLGPFLPRAESMADDEVLLTDWKEAPLHAKPGDTITITYFQPEQEGKLSERKASFRLRGLVPLEGVANDPDLTPEFPGITDKLTIQDWNPPFPYENKRIQRRDERYWEEYRTAPKAYVSLAAGQKLWGSRFGRLTSIRLAPAASGTPGTGELAKAAEAFSRSLLNHLRPEQGGLVFDAVRERGLAGSSGSTDFGGLFLGFSCFLIAAALLLVGLLFRLNLDRRAGEIGLLLSLGYRRTTVRRLLLLEGAALAALGGLIGLIGSLLYAWLMLEFLRSWWPGGLDRSVLHLHVTGQSLVIGYGSAFIVSILTILWAVRVLGRVSPRALLAGDSSEVVPSPSGGQRPRWSLWVARGSAVGALACILLGSRIDDSEEQAMTFFGSGALMLTAGLAALWVWMHGTRHRQVTGHGKSALARLGIRNAARHPIRSLLTAGLVASATFLIVAVEAFYRDPGRNFLDRQSGSGGFALLGESDVPLYQDLNSTRGRDELNIPDTARADLRDVTFYPLRLHGGDDASCLNLYQPRRPRLLGVPPSLVDRGGFLFKEAESGSPETRGNPWDLLQQPRDDGAIPVFGEANTVQWILHSGLGRELEVPNERGDPVRLRVVGLLQDSIFQGELLLSEDNFLKLYPREEGYSLFLIQTPAERRTQVKAALETALAEYGFTVTRTDERLASFLAVENTYLSTFQALGGLGLVLGALGLAVVLVRSIWERRAELALLRALGYRESALSWLVLTENGFLLLLGLAVGTVTALVAVAPHLLQRSSEIPWARWLGLLVVALVVGLSAGAVAVSRSLRAPLLPALRRE